MYKSEFFTSKKAWYTYELRSDNSFIPILFNRSIRYPSFFSTSRGFWEYRNHLKFLKHMHILNIKSRTPYHIWFLIMEKPEGLHCLSIFILEWFQSGRNFSRPRKIKIVHILYKELVTKYNNEFLKNPWIDCMHSIFYNYGFSSFWNENAMYCTYCKC